MLTAMERRPNRAAHMRFIVKAPGHEDVITQLFPLDCPFLEMDAVFGVKETLIGDFRQVDDPVKAAELGFDGKFWLLDWNFKLATAKP